MTLDTVLLILLIGFAAWGFANGLIRAVGGIVGIVLGAIIASRYYLAVATVLESALGSFPGLGAVVSFAIIFLLVGRLFGIVVHLFEQAFDLLAIIPFLKSINRLSGALFGLLLGALILGTILYVAGRYSHWTAFNDAAAHSALAQSVLIVARVLAPFFPEALRQLQTYF